MAQSLHTGWYGSSTNLPFGICAIYCDLVVNRSTGVKLKTLKFFFPTKICQLDILRYPLVQLHQFSLLSKHLTTTTNYLNKFEKINSSGLRLRYISYNLYCIIIEFETKIYIYIIDIFVLENYITTPVPTYESIQTVKISTFPPPKAPSYMDADPPIEPWRERSNFAPDQFPQVSWVKSGWILSVSLSKKTRKVSTHVGFRGCRF